MDETQSNSDSSRREPSEHENDGRFGVESYGMTTTFHSTVVIASMFLPGMFEKHNKRKCTVYHAFARARWCSGKPY